METTYALTAYNSETIYAYGTLEDAHEYCEWLNRRRDVNLYGPEAVDMTDEEAENKCINLIDEIAAIPEMEEIEAMAYA